MAQFRFMDLNIWKDAIKLNQKFYVLADQICDAKSYRFAEQIRGTSLRVSPIILQKELDLFLTKILQTF